MSQREVKAAVEDRLAHHLNALGDVLDHAQRVSNVAENLHGAFNGPTASGPVPAQPKEQSNLTSTLGFYEAAEKQLNNIRDELNRIHEKLEGMS